MLARVSLTDRDLVHCQIFAALSNVAARIANLKTLELYNVVGFLTFWFECESVSFKSIISFLNRCMNFQTDLILTGLFWELANSFANEPSYC